MFRNNFIKRNKITFGSDGLPIELNQGDSAKDLIMLMEILKKTNIIIINKKLMSKSFVAAVLLVCGVTCAPISNYMLPKGEPTQFYT